MSPFEINTKSSQIKAEIQKLFSIFSSHFNENEDNKIYHHNTSFVDRV